MSLTSYTSKSVSVGLIKFNAGLNSSSGPLGLSNNESSSLQNIDFNKFGSIKKRSGYTPANTSAISGSPQVAGLHFFELSTGTRYLVATAGAKLFQWNASSITGAPTDITDSLTITAGSLVDSATFRDTALFTNGTDLPWKWTGSGNAAAMTVPTNLTKAKFVKIFQNYTFLANVTVDSVTYGSRVYYSNINSISSWTDSDFVDVSRDDGQSITGLKALGDKLVIFKDRSIWIAQFTGNADVPFTFSPTNSPVGCVSHFSIQKIDNGLIFLSWDGLYFFDGFNAYKISDRINSTFTTDMNPLKFVNAVSCYQATKNRYWLAITATGGTTNSRVITWTRAETTTGITDAFGVYKGINASSLSITYPDGVTEVPYFGDYSGFVYKADTGLDDYPLNVQTAIDAYYYTNWISYDDLVSQKGTLAVDVYYQNNTALLNFVYAYDFNDGDQFTQLFSTSTGAAVYDTAIYDVDVYAGGGGSFSRREITGRGRVVRYGFKNMALTETFQIDGIGTLPYLETASG